MGKNNALKFVFIHGAGGTKNKWRSIIPVLGENENICLDLPSHGENKAEQCETIEDYANVLSASLTEDCIVVGHSMGGLVALELGARSDKVKGIVLAASSYKLPVHPNIIATLREGTFPDFLFRASYAKGASQDLLEEEEQELDNSPTDVAMKDFQACDNYKIGKETLKQLQKPILAVIGDEDRLIPPNTEEELKALNPHVQVAKIEGAGHYIALEKPEEFVNHILQFRKVLEE
ncbi:hypothetical protein DCC39_04015 [Pueribacillus theae]|uniref:AB hydrolase-1 domain-containing protein n=1 Tax=Pueribacillus theae TaxID=2171751 RepID=A0A2U1K7F9_9BACI|nr:alpha/beta hydrolase [Pueribacillus theae]PWA12818.1 hypothetical protein DCC39_04015 [Pueribacillus theae]